MCEDMFFQTYQPGDDDAPPSIHEEFLYVTDDGADVYGIDTDSPLNDPMFHPLVLSCVQHVFVRYGERVAFVVVAGDGGIVFGVYPED